MVKSILIICQNQFRVESVSNYLISLQIALFTFQAMTLVFNKTYCINQDNTTIVDGENLVSPPRVT